MENEGQKTKKQVILGWAPPEGPALYRNLRNAIIAPDGFFSWKCHFET